MRLYINAPYNYWWKQLQGHVHLLSLQHGSCWDPSVLPELPTPGMLVVYKTEAHVGINCCKSGAKETGISSWLPRFSGIDDTVLASSKFILQAVRARKSLMMCLQPACPAHSSFLFLDVLLNACSGQRDVTACDTPVPVRKGPCFCLVSFIMDWSAKFSPWKPPEQDRSQEKAQGDAGPPSGWV